MTGPWKTARLRPPPLPGKQHQAGHQGQHLDRETVQKDSQEYLLCKTMISIGTTSGKRPNLRVLLSRSRESPQFLPPMTSRLVWRGARSLHVSSAGLTAVVGLPGAMSQPTLDSSDNRNDLQRLPDSLDTQPVGTCGGKPRCFTSAFPGVPDGCVAGPVFLSGALRI